MRFRCSLTAASLAFFTCACSAPPEDPSEHTPTIAPVPVKIDVVRTDPWPDTWQSTGFVRKAEPVTLSARMTGVIRRVAVSKGQRVRAGDLLIAFDTSDLDDSIQKAASAKPASPEEVRRAAEAVESARQNLSAAKTDEARKIARAALDRTLSHQAVLRTRSSSVSAAREATESLRQTASVLAPSGGKIVELFAVSGRLVTIDTPLIRIDPDDLFFEASVETARLGGAAAGSPVSIDFGGECKGESKILDISDSPDSGRLQPSRKSVRTGLPKCGANLNAHGRIRFEGPPHPVVTVAKAALIMRENRTFVYMVQDGFTKLQRITTAEERDGRLETIAGLAPGSKVVVEPGANLKDHLPVTVPPQK